MIRVDPSRSELIRPGLAVRVDPVRLLYLPVCKVIRYVVLTMHILKCHYDQIFTS